MKKNGSKLARKGFQNEVFVMLNSRPATASGSLNVQVGRSILAKIVINLVMGAASR
jgi:hypothetical protein